MMLVRVENGTALLTSLDQFRNQFPHIALPDNPSEAALKRHNLYPVYVDPYPEHNVYQKAIRSDNPVKDSNGRYHLTYSVVNLGQTEISDMQDQMERAVIEERCRRLSLGFDYDFGDERGIHRIGTSEDDMIGWDQVTKLATAAILGGFPGTLIDVVTDTGPVQVTATEWQSMVVTISQAGQPVWHYSFQLMAMNPIPANYADDIWWTSST